MAVIGSAAPAWAAVSTLSGRTMGTRYHITVITDGAPAADLQARVDDRLEAVNRSMNTYDAQSEISRFNRYTGSEPFPISDAFAAVMESARWIHRQTGGAWDGTIRPLVELWGFSGELPRTTLPDPAEIRQALEKVGFDRIQLAAGPALLKTSPELSVDLASIAKGYGVDQIAALLTELDYPNYLVEIGGEIFARGRNANGDPWRIGINRPESTAGATAVYKVLALSDMAMATSGDYRQFFEIDGRRYAHILDPARGYPVDNGVVSATVIAENCTLADGLATALVVMGVDRGLRLVERLIGVEALLIVRGKDGRLRDHPSSGLSGR